MKNIVIIGVGQLGSRHLQALALYEKELDIYLVDPQQESLQQGKKRFEEVNRFKNKRLYFRNKIDDLPTIIDFAVIATNSLQRLMVLKELVTHSSVNYVLLEKFLFPNVEEYVEAHKLITENGIKAYVNCARRMWPDYQKIRDEIHREANIKVTVDGENWSLGSNAIHFLDLFFYFTGEQDITMNTSKLDRGLLNNKREGYVEFSGTLQGVTTKGNILHLTSALSNKVTTEITIESNEKKYIIHEAQQIMEIFNQGQMNKTPFRLFYQSSLTNQVLEQFDRHGTCDLVSFEESTKYHLILLKAFNSVLGEREGAIT
jgi:predicted dehydrogenase